MKSQNYPETIPAAYAGNEILERAYRIGWNRGHGIACHNVPTLGDRVFSDSLGRITVDAENIREYHESLCFEAELNGRDFSPFEFIASEFNKLDEEEEGSSEEAWQAYDQGVADAKLSRVEKSDRELEHSNTKQNENEPYAGAVAN